MIGYKFLGLLSLVALLFSHIQASSLLEEGFKFARRLDQAAPTPDVDSDDAPNVDTPDPEDTPARPSPIPPPPPAYLGYPPPPTQITNRALLYNYPIQLRPGEYLVYRQTDQFDIVGAPPSVDVDEVEDVLDARPEASYRNLDPESAPVFTQLLGPAIATIPKEAQQSFINLLTPDIKSAPSVSQAIEENGLQGAPAPIPPPTMPMGGSAAPTSFKVALSIVILIVSMLVILF